MNRHYLNCVALVAFAGSALGFNTGHLDSDAEYLSYVPSPGFVAEGRIGDLGGAATFELDLGQETSAPAVTRQYGWVSGQVEPFTLTFDALSSQATFEIGGQTLIYDVTALSFTHLFVRTRAVNADSSVLVDNLFYNATAVGDVSAADGNASGIDYLVIEDADPLAGFVLTGDATLSWSGAAPTQSRLAFEIKLVEVNESVPSQETSMGRLKSEFEN